MANIQAAWSGGILGAARSSLRVGYLLGSTQFCKFAELLEVMMRGTFFQLH